MTAAGIVLRKKQRSEKSLRCFYQAGSAQGLGEGLGKLRIQAPAGQMLPGFFQRNSPQTVEALAQINFPPIVFFGPLPDGIFPIQFFYTIAAVPDKGIVSIAIDIIGVFSHSKYLLFDLMGTI
jgi:hypothetical protein